MKDNGKEITGKVEESTPMEMETNISVNGWIIIDMEMESIHIRMETVMKESSTKTKGMGWE